MAASPTIGVVANPPAAVVRQPPGLLLSGIAGYVDAAGYLALYGLFTAHVTGNLVTAGSALARSATEGVGPKLTMLPVFMSAVGATTLLIRWLHRKGIAPLVPLLALMTGALALFFLT
ncbi:MAG TPA: YoaK family protein, partial [Polyangiaceae bacterium]|nr:YoaK family protein [Polyangiaceae bacterium]